MGQTKQHTLPIITLSEAEEKARVAYNSSKRSVEKSFRRTKATTNRFDKKE